jgi:hypothetical protein
MQERNRSAVDLNNRIGQTRLWPSKKVGRKKATVEHSRNPFSSEKTGFCRPPVPRVGESAGPQNAQKPAFSEECGFRSLGIAG